MKAQIKLGKIFGIEIGLLSGVSGKFLDSLDEGVHSNEFRFCVKSKSETNNVGFSNDFTLIARADL